MEVKCMAQTQQSTNELVDIKDVKINMDLPKEERIIDFLKQIKNPYHCKYGDIAVELSFMDNNITLTERIKQHMRMM